MLASIPVCRRRQEGNVRAAFDEDLRTFPQTSLEHPAETSLCLLNRPGWHGYFLSCINS
jgi:hypothetical protein